MRITRYTLPQTMNAREQYRILKAEGYPVPSTEPPQDMTDEQILEVIDINHICKVSEAKRMLKKYGGSAWTEWYDRDGSYQDCMEIRLNGRNTGSYGSI